MSNIKSKINILEINNMQKKKYGYPLGNEYTWEYCCKNKLPLITIDEKGWKYSYISFDAWPFAKFERFRVINYFEHILPLYLLYKKYSKLPDGKYSITGSGNSGGFTVFKKDVNEIVPKLYDLLMELGKRDEELFNMEPFQVDEDGNNAEGWNEIDFPQYLKKLTDDKLILLYKGMIYNDYLKYRPREKALYEYEIKQRNLTVH